jgi:hypothetical protein
MVAGLYQNTQEDAQRMMEMQALIDQMNQMRMQRDVDAIPQEMDQMDPSTPNIPPPAIGGVPPNIPPPAIGGGLVGQRGVPPNIPPPAIEGGLVGQRGVPRGSFLSPEAVESFRSGQVPMEAQQALPPEVIQQLLERMRARRLAEQGLE